MTGPGYALICNLNTQRTLKYWYDRAGLRGYVQLKKHTHSALKDWYDRAGLHGYVQLYKHRPAHRFS